MPVQALAWWTFFLWYFLTNGMVQMHASMRDNACSRRMLRQFHDRVKVMVQAYDVSWCLYSHYMLQ
eukprot:11595684-Ditylum_brightwellii.AAC.1